MNISRRGFVATMAIVTTGIASGAAFDAVLASPSKPWAMEAINARLLLNRIVKDIQKVYVDFHEYIKFEPLDAISRGQMTCMVSAYMQHMVNLRTVYEYQIICDERNNPPSQIETSFIGLTVIWKDFMRRDEYTLKITGERAA